MRVRLLHPLGKQRFGDRPRLEDWTSPGGMICAFLACWILLLLADWAICFGFVEWGAGIELGLELVLTPDEVEAIVDGAVVSSGDHVVFDTDRNLVQRFLIDADGRIAVQTVSRVKRSHDRAVAIIDPSCDATYGDVVSAIDLAGRAQRWMVHPCEESEPSD